MSAMTEKGMRDLFLDLEAKTVLIIVDDGRQYECVVSSAEGEYVAVELQNKTTRDFDVPCYIMYHAVHVVIEKA